VRGNHKTRTDLILREIALSPGDTVAADDARVERARLRLLALGYFLDARLSMIKGERRGSGAGHRSRGTRNHHPQGCLPGHQRSHQRVGGRRERAQSVGRG